MILLIDNYDSFTYNLFHYIAQVSLKKEHKDILVKRNDKISLKEIEELSPAAIILSPGPCTPNEAGICLDVIREFKEKYPILGVCLGHQAIGQAFGGDIIKTYPMHGKVSKVFHDNSVLFKEIPSPFNATRYHSLVIKKENIPDCLKIRAWTEDGIIMAVEHNAYKIFGVQFHPESIASDCGHQIIRNFLEIC